jgi:hypothetical protein
MLQGEPERSAPETGKEFAMPLFMDVHESLPEGATVSRGCRRRA